MKRLQSVDMLRAIASVTVAWNHFSIANHNIHLGDSLLVKLFTLPALFSGKFVLLFFVISGLANFMLLSKLDKSFQTCKTFLLRSFFRLYIPFFCAALLSLFAYYIGSHNPFYKTPAYDFSTQDLLANILLFSDFSETSDWFNPVFWNIPLQMQFLLFAGILYATQSSFKLITWILLGMSLVAPYYIDRNIVFHFTPFFSIGFAYFMLFTEKEKTKLYPFLWISSFILIIVYFGYLEASLCLLPIVLEKLNIRLGRSLSFMANISFSLYLTHTVIGGRAVNFLTKVLPENGYVHLGICFIALAVSIVFAYLFYLIIEKPMHNYSKKIIARQKATEARV